MRRSSSIPTRRYSDLRQSASRAPMMVFDSVLSASGRSQGQKELIHCVSFERPSKGKGYRTPNDGQFSVRSSASVESAPPRQDHPVTAERADQPPSIPNAKQKIIAHLLRRLRV